MANQTLGEKRIRTEFNPSGVGNVNYIKENCAKLIDVLDAIHPHADESKQEEADRLKAIAMTAIEEAAMWAVKAATV